MNSRSTFLVARIRGIPVRIHVTFLVALPFFAYSFGQTFSSAARLAGTPPEELAGSPWMWGLGLALALFASVLVHELAHSLYALRQGGQVRSITLHMVGGVSELSTPPRREAVMALAGPVTSLALGAIFVGLARLGRGTGLPDLGFGLFYLGQLNLGLGLFNLLPAFPMDGGRILRGVLARRIGLVRATRTASAVGRAFAFLFVGAGLVTGNIMLLLIALVVYVGAEAEARDVLLRSQLGDAPVRDFMSPLDGSVAADDTLLAVGERMIRERRTSYPVTEATRVVGFVTVDALKRVPPEKRASTLAREAARPAVAVDAGERLVDALPKLREAGASGMAVVDADRLVGTLSQLDVARGLELRELSPRQDAAGVRSTA